MTDFFESERSTHFQGKQAEPPSQPAPICKHCGRAIEIRQGRWRHVMYNGAYCFKAAEPAVAESPSQAGTRPKCNCGAGDDAYLACHADVCALKKWAAPRYEVSQATKEEWARRIALAIRTAEAIFDMDPEDQQEQARFAVTRLREVLALMTNEGEKI